ncbi:MAG: ABC transporter ATP-binding protein [Deltaproteobacteria bacterium]|nr:ABC transporter ATP-binding protein [Deltaproteobacteria bacterium]
MAAETSMPCLELRRIGIGFHGKPLLEEISFTVSEQEIVSFIGPNGVGKTTLFNIICGRSNPTSGAVIYRGMDITGWSPHRICHLGIARTFQISRPFPRMTVLENVLMGIWFGKEEQVGSQAGRDEALDLLNLVGLRHKAGQEGRDLTVSELRRLELARALATRPKLLLLDEIAAGLSPQAIREAVVLINALREQGLTLLIIDHFLNLTCQVSDRLIALCDGRLTASGRPADVLNSPEVIRAYFGRSQN